MGSCCTKQTETYTSVASIINEIEYWLEIGRPYQALRLYRLADLEDRDLAERIETGLKNSRALTE